MRLTSKLTTLSGIVLGLCLHWPAVYAEVKPQLVVDGLSHPWSVAFLPNGRYLITERAGRLRLVENGKLLAQPVAGLPEIAAVGQGGLLDVVLHPDYAHNGWLYFSYAKPVKGGQVTAVMRAKLKNMQLLDQQPIFQMNKASDSGRHFGSRLAFDKQGMLFISVGERGEREWAQDLSNHAGSIIRLHDDGRIPADNPFIHQTGAQPEIYSYGHRNPQGMVLHPESGDIWIHEHGPKGGDEINRIQAGNNYGWPVISYGRNYGWGTKIGEGTHKAGMEQPLHQWTPSIAPSGMTFYTGERYPEWQGKLLVGSLKFHYLSLLSVEGENIGNEQLLFKRDFGRIRDVRQGPEGYLYLLTDEANGQLIRLVPR